MNKPQSGKRLQIQPPLLLTWKDRHIFSAPLEADPGAGRSSTVSALGKVWVLPADSLGSNEVVRGDRGNSQVLFNNICPRTAGGRQLVTHLSVVKTAGRQQFIGLYSYLLGSKSREGREGQGLERDPVFRDLLEKCPESRRQTPYQIEVVLSPR